MVKRVDLRYFRANGLLQSGTCGEITWRCRNKALTGRALYRVGESYIDVVLGREYGVIETSQKLKLTSTACHYGGERKWLLCPICNGRSVALYIVQASFYCRTCAGLTYRTSASSKSGRVHQKRHKLGKQTFEVYENGSGQGRKKGMHNKTFNKLELEYQKFQSESLALIEARLVHLIR